MKNFYLNLLIILLLSFSFVFANCNDGIDNDGDDTIDTEDVGCLDSTDASERDYGYQIQIDSDADESCVEFLIQSDESCFEDHYESFAWLFAFMVPEMFSSCLDDYSSNYFGLTYDSSKPYTKIAVGDCVYDHKDDYLDLVLSEYGSLDDSQKEIYKEMCYQVFYDEYYLNCETSITTETVCSDGLDDDSDDLIDCADPDCAGIDGCDYQYETCDDDFDNDGDGLEDCDDDDCSSDSLCIESGNCDDGIDNDGDDLYDCDDDDCSGDEAACPTSGCVEDGDCDPGEYCDEINGGVCVEDTSDNVCVDSDCGNYVCNPDDKPNCYSQCGSNIECSSGYVCDGYGSCVVDIVECDESVCDEGYVCDTTNNVCYESCTSNDECSSDAACVVDDTNGHLGECIVCEVSDPLEGSYNRNGLDYDNGGSVVGVWMSSYYIEAFDKCFNSDKLIEYYCQKSEDNTYVFRNSVICSDQLAGSECLEDGDGYGYCGIEVEVSSAGCTKDEDCTSTLGSTYACDTASGSCVTCTESDGESDYLTQGTVTGISIDGGIYGTVSDYCVDGDNVYEYFCMSTGYYNTDGEVDCGEGFGCADGACYLIAPAEDSSDTSCATDGVCAEGLFCDTDGYYGTWECVECIEGEGMCAEGYTCEDYVCVSSSGPSSAPGIEESFLTKFLSWLVFW